MEGVKAKWDAFCQAVMAVVKWITQVYEGIENFFRLIISYIMRVHKAILAAPVVIAAARLAQYSFENLPERVGLDFQASGEFAVMISRDAAVLAPLVVTGGCLLLMFCSRRTIYPWIISIFTLTLPLLILATNNLDAFVAIAAPAMTLIMGLLQK